MAESTPRSSGRIFISYRRQETSYPAGWLFDRLVEHYGDGQVFKDVDSVEPGDDFVDVLRTAVGSCEALLALIGARWATITDEEGRRRLDSPDDFVRLEIETALERNIRVIPILVDGAAMPQVEQLPPSLTKLARRQALELSPSRFEYDTNRLLKVLSKTLGGEAPPAVEPRPAVAAPTRPDRAAANSGLSPGPVLHPDGASDDAGPVVAPPPRPPPVLRDSPSPSQHPPPAPPAPPTDTGAHGGPRRWPLFAGLGVAGMVVAASGLLLSSRAGPEAPPPPQVATIKVGGGSSGVAVGPQDVWVSNYDDGTVSRLDPASGRVLATIPVGKAGGDIVACPDVVWVISDSRFIARIDPTSRQVTGRFQVGAPVVDLAVRCGESVWASGADGTISRIRQGATGAETFLTAAQDLVADVDVDPQGVLWLSHPSGNRVLRLDPTTKKLQRIDVGAAPIGVTAAQLDTVWVTSSKANTVSQIDPTSNKVVKTFSVGPRPWGAAVGLGALWVTNLDGGSVSRVDIASGTVSTISVGSKPDGIAVGHGAVWVANGGSGTISRIT